MLGAVLGCGFGFLIGLLSPEFTAMLAHPHPLDQEERFVWAIGLICGLLIGTATMIAARFITALRTLRTRSKSN